MGAHHLEDKTRDIVQAMNLTMRESARELISQEQLAITELSTLLGRLDAEEGDLNELKSALRDLEGLFMLVVCGEYNAGKSTFLNALLGAKVMLEGVTPTTDRITIVTYGETPRDTEESGLTLRREYPAEMLRDIALVDTPGTNAVIKEHQTLTERFIPRADLVLFITSADRPFTESERVFLELISSWGKKIVVVVNKIDFIEEEGEREKVLGFIAEQAYKTLGMKPKLFGVASRQALRARLQEDPVMLEASGLLELEQFITRTLESGERLKLKLLNPLGVAQHITHDYQRVIHERLTLLEGDRRTLGEVDRQLTQFERDMQREFESQLARVKTVLLEVERRGDVFFDEVVQLRRMFDLLNNEKIREMFQNRVIRGAEHEIDKTVSDMVDWFIQRNLQLWEEVMAFLQERRQAGEKRLIGEVGGRFQYDRTTLLRTLTHSAEEVMASFDQDTESRRLAESLHGAVVQTGLMQVGGIGLGAAIIAFLSGSIFDLTGVMAGATLVGMGLFVLPRSRRKAKRQLHQNMQELRDKLSASLTEKFNDELHHASQKLTAAISPYTRFVRSELGRLETLEGELGELDTRLQQLRSEIERLEP